MSVRMLDWHVTAQANRQTMVGQEEGLEASRPWLCAGFTPKLPMSTVAF